MKELKNLSAPEKGYMHVCQNPECRAVFYTSVRCAAKWCPNCRRTIIKNASREYYRRLAQKKKANETAAAKEAMANGSPNYCEKMHCSNPGKMCGTREFCTGCQHVGGVRCYDPSGTIVT